VYDGISTSDEHTEALTDGETKPSSDISYGLDNQQEVAG
jgi:hypothetical protein